MNLYTIVIKDCEVPNIGAIHEMLIRFRDHFDKKLLREIVNKCMEYGETCSNKHHVIAQIFRNGDPILGVAYASRRQFYPDDKILYYCDLLRINRKTGDVDRWTIREGVMAKKACQTDYMGRHGL